VGYRRVAVVNRSKWNAVKVPLTYGAVRQDSCVNGWTAKVEAPFRDDAKFWASVGRSADALWTLAIATLLVAVSGAYAAIAFIGPAVLLVVSGRDARASTAQTRPLFPTRDEWRAAERQAVAAALPGAFVRYFRR
jgi:hypothetical protein